LDAKQVLAIILLNTFESYQRLSLSIYQMIKERWWYLWQRENFLYLL